MGAWSSIVRKLFSGFAVALLGVAIATPLGGAEGYLPRSGPAALRFAAAPLQAKAFVWPPLRKDESAPSNSLPEAASAPASTNSAPVPAAPGATNWVVDPALLDPTQFPVDTNSVPNSESPASSASELLIVTPQMLAEYLKPALSGALKAATNAPSSGDVGFLPPTPKPAASSEAIYRTQ